MMMRWMAVEVEKEEEEEEDQKSLVVSAKESQTLA